MRNFLLLALAIGLVGFVGSAAGDEKKITPPRLQIKTDLDYRIGPAALKNA